MNNTVNLEKTKLEKKKKLNHDHWQLTILVIPAILMVIIFSYIPMFGITIAFKDYSFNLGIFDSPFVGFDNFKLFFASSNFWTLIRNTLGYSLASLILGPIVAIFFALMLDIVRKKYFIKFFQTSMFLPYFLSWIVVGFITHTLFEYNAGILNQILNFFGHESITIYTEPKYWPFILTFLHIWKGIGMSVMMFYGTILGLDGEVEEASLIDGCSYLQYVRHIVLPHLKEIVIIMTIMGIGNVFRSDWGMHYYIPKDTGALYAVTDTLDVFIQRSLLVGGSVSASSAASLMQSILGLVLVLTVNSVIKRLDEDGTALL